MNMKKKTNTTIILFLHITTFFFPFFLFQLKVPTKKKKTINGTSISITFTRVLLTWTFSPWVLLLLSYFNLEYLSIHFTKLIMIAKIILNLFSFEKG